jgi:chondroitin 4-sulfotransferase 11
MLISHRLGCIFVHVPKTAGSSMDRWLQSLDPSADRILPDVAATHVPAKGKHMFASDLRGGLPSGLWSDYFKFGFVRNPFDRLVSWYHMCLQRPDEDYRRYVLAITSGFDDFVAKCDRFAGRAAMIGFNQVDHLCDADGAPLVDFIGRFENLAEDLATVMDALGASGELPRFNESHHRDYRVYFDGPTVAAAARRFGRDLERFGYEF